jgi:hypothetical protein
MVGRILGCMRRVVKEAQFRAGCYAPGLNLGQPSSPSVSAASAMLLATHDADANAAIKSVVVTLHPFDDLVSMLMSSHFRCEQPLEAFALDPKRAQEGMKAYGVAAPKPVPPAQSEAEVTICSHDAIAALRLPRSWRRRSRIN